MDFSKRLVIFWADDSWLSSLDPNFHEALLDRTESHGQPTHIEFREGALGDMKEVHYERKG